MNNLCLRLQPIVFKGKYETLLIWMKKNLPKKSSNNFEPISDNINNYCNTQIIFFQKLAEWCCQCTLLQGGCKSKNQCLQILIKYTFLYSKWRITLEKVQNWSFHCFNSAKWANTFLSFTSKTCSKLTNHIGLLLLKWWPTKLCVTDEFAKTKSTL